MFVLGLFVFLPGLGDHGFWSVAEMPVLDRTRAALGAAVSGLERSPWVPDALRTAVYARLPNEFGLRLPHALAGAGLAAIASGLARWRGATPLLAVLAGLFVLAMPSVVASARTVLGNPVAELSSACAIVFGLGAVRTPRVGIAVVAALAAAVALALAIASAGLALGGLVPLLVLALADDGERTRRVKPFLWGAVVVILGITIRLVLQQGDGYIALLGAAKQLELVDKPEARRFAAIVQEYGEHVAPWGGLAAIGAALGRRARLPAIWALVALVVGGGWSLVYGELHLPVAVPTALCCTAAIDALLHGRLRAHGRRLIVFIALGGMLVMRKDAERTPSRIVVPVWRFDLEQRFPDEDVQASRRLRRIAGLAMLALLGASVFARRREDEPGGRLAALVDRLAPTWRVPVAVSIVAMGVGYASLTHARTLVPALCRVLSPADILRQHAQWVASGALPAELAAHRVRDPGLSHYGPDSVHVLQNRREIIDYLASSEPKVALVRNLDVPILVQHDRSNELQFFVLDARHEHYRLVANVLPQGVVDQNPTAGVVFDHPPRLANETLVRFEDYVEVIAWEVEAPLIRGTTRKLRLVLKALRPVPGGTKIYARFLKGRMSRINAEAHEIAANLYSPNLWRAGDYILHEIDIDVPVLEILSGKHELVVGLRRSEHKNYDITVPEERGGEHGVTIKDRKRNFAVLGEVQVW